MTEESKMEVEPTSKEETTETKNEYVTPSASGETAAKYPDMKLAQSIHRAILMSGTNPKLTTAAASAVSIDIPDDLPSQVLKQVQEMENPSLYKHLAPLLSWNAYSQSDLDAMEKQNKEKIQELEKKVEDAKENAGDMEVLDARFEVAKFAAKSCSKEEAFEAYQKVLDLPKLSTGKQMDALMEKSRIASFYGDMVSNAEVLKKIAKLAEESGDWDRRNRLKVYNSLCKLLTRDVKGASSLLIDCIATFSCNELCSYSDFILYTMISNLLYLPRTEIKAKIVDGPDRKSVV